MRRRYADCCRCRCRLLILARVKAVLGGRREDGADATTRVEATTCVDATTRDDATTRVDRTGALLRFKLPRVFRVRTMILSKAGATRSRLTTNIKKAIPAQQKMLTPNTTNNIINVVFPPSDGGGLGGLNCISTNRLALSTTTLSTGILNKFPYPKSSCIFESSVNTCAK